MSGEPAKPDGKPDGDEKKGRPNDERAQTEAVLEEGLPEHQKRKPRAGDGGAGRA